MTKDEGYEIKQCTHCNGSGEGMYDGSTCLWCGGSGADERGSDEDEEVVK